MSTVAAGWIERRRRILTAAGDLFAREAYAVVQMDEIARAAGVAKPTLYRHFGTKEALFAEAVAASLGELKAEAQQIVDGKTSPIERFREVVQVLSRRIGQLKALVREAESGGSHLGDRGRAVIRRELRGVRAVIAEVIGEGVAAGDIAPVDPDLAARIVLGAIRMTSGAAGTDTAGSVADLLLNGLASSLSHTRQSTP
jgi:AcrR family transcriptional regulator